MHEKHFLSLEYAGKQEHKPSGDFILIYSTNDTNISRSLKIKDKVLFSNNKIHDSNFIGVLTEKYFENGKFYFVLKKPYNSYSSGANWFIDKFELEDIINFSLTKILQESNNE